MNLAPTKTETIYNIYVYSLPTVPLGDWLEKKNVPAIIIKQQFGFAIKIRI